MRRGEGYSVATLLAGEVGSTLAEVASEVGATRLSRAHHGGGPAVHSLGWEPATIAGVEPGRNHSARLGFVTLHLDRPPLEIRVPRAVVPLHSRVGSHLRVRRSQDGERVLAAVLDDVARAVAMLRARGSS